MVNSEGGGIGRTSRQGISRRKNLGSEEGRMKKKSLGRYLGPISQTQRKQEIEHTERKKGKRRVKPTFTTEFRFAFNFGWFFWGVVGFFVCFVLVLGF